LVVQFRISEVINFVVTYNFQGKIARTLACKASLAVRIDAFDGSNNDPKIGIKVIMYKIF